MTLPKKIPICGTSVTFWVNTQPDGFRITYTTIKFYIASRHSQL